MWLHARRFAAGSLLQETVHLAAVAQNSCVAQAPADPADVALREALDRRDAAFQRYLARNPGPGQGSAAAAGDMAPAAGDPNPGGSRWESDAELAARLNAADAALLAALSARGSMLYPDPNLCPDPGSVGTGGAVLPMGAPRSAGMPSGSGGGGEPGESENPHQGPGVHPAGARQAGGGRMERDAELAARLNAADAAFTAAMNARDAGARG